MSLRTRRFEYRAVSLMAIAAMIVAASAGPVSAAATLVGDYQFQNTLTNSAGTAPALTEFSRKGTTAEFVTDTVAGSSRTVWDWPESHGLVLNGANNHVGNFYSIVMLVKLDSITYYNKLIDLRHGSDQDSGLYVLDSNLVAYGCGAGRSTSNPISSGTYHQIVMTRDSSKKIRLYVDGAQVATSDDTTDGCSMGAASDIHFLVDDTYTCSTPEATDCEEAPGRIARLRVYNGALTSAEVASLGTVPGSEPPPGTAHDRTVSLTLKKHLLATGSVSVLDGFTGCAQGVTVVIQRKTASGFKAVGATVTTMTGTFKKKVKDKPGVYRASVAATSAGGSDTCGAATSPKKRHKH